MPVQDREIDVGQQRGGDSSLRSAREGLRESAMHLDNPGPQKRADQPQNLAVLDALGHQVHQDVMVNVDAPMDVKRRLGLVPCGLPRWSWGR
jgi:hypothetical protein